MSETSPAAVVPEIGVHEAIPFAEYRAWEAVSASRLTDLARSPAYCRHRIANPDEPTDAQRFGAACHCGILEPDDFTTRYAAAPECDRRTREGKALYADFLAASPGQEPLKADEYARCIAIRDAVHSHPAASALLKRQTRREVSMAWDRDGLRCKGRIDVLASDLVGDVKVTRDAHPDDFERYVAAYGVHRQMAFYLSGLAELDRKPEAAVIGAVEPLPPHEVAVYVLDPYAIRCGDEEVRRLIARYAECARSGVWPGYDPGVLSVSVPLWVQRNAFPEEYAT